MGGRHPSGMTPGARRVLLAIESAGECGLTQDDLTELADLSRAGVRDAIKCLSNLGAIHCDKTIRRGFRGVRSRVYTVEPSFSARPTCGLWPYQLEILYWMAAGKNDEEICEILGKHKHYAGRVVNEILDTLGAANRVGAVAIGFRKGLLS